VFFHGPWGLEHRFACRSRPRPLPVRLRDALVAGWLHRVEARALGAAGRLFVASQYVAGRLRKWHPGVRIPAEVVGGGANLARFREVADRAAVRAKFGAAPGETVFLAVRRLDPRMGLGLLIEAFASVASAHPGARLWITGRGAQREELGRLAERLGVAETIRFLGFVPEPDLPDLYAAADLAVMPSLDLEGFGLVTAEALACGTPVLASRAGANAEVVGPLADGLLFASGSATALAAKLDDALSGRLVPPPRAECAAHARREFRWDRAADAFERAWTERRGAAR
jgi:glycosyltransferase involved in cell wall biosynthesis